MTVADYLHAKKINAEELAAVLSERLNRSITAAAVIAQGDKPMRKAWRDALGVEDVPEPVAEEIIEEVTGEKPKRKSAKAPTPVGDFNPFLAEQRVAAIYAMAGKGVSMATREPRYEQAFRSHADQCGKAWVSLAAHDKHVATILTALTAGGPWGEVIWIHASLVFSLVVISGKVNLDGIGIVPGPPKPDAPPSDDGSSSAGAADPVAEA
jgi:hypothetical protein